MIRWLSFSDARIGLSTVTGCPTSDFALLQTPIARVVMQEPNPARPHDPATFNRVRHTVYHLCER